MNKPNSTKLATPNMTDFLNSARVNTQGYPKWNPVTHPYRVVCTVSAPAPAYARDICGVFASESEARVAFEAPAPRGMQSVRIDRARNPENWNNAGGWVRIARRTGRARQ